MLICWIKILTFDHLTSFDLNFLVWPSFRQWFDIIFSISGDWHTAYLLLYGPRKLAKDYKKPSTEEAKASEKASEEEKMETWI